MIVTLMLPIQLKFGAEKGRIAIIAIGGGVWAVGTILFNNLPDDTQPSVMLSNLNAHTVTIFIIVFCLVALAVSYLISLHIMENKDY